MKKRLITYLVLIVLLFSGCTLLIDKLLLDEYDVLKLNWNINLPKADEVTDLLTTETSFNGDGEWFTLFNYSKPIDLNNTNFIKLTSNEITDANSKIEQFKNRTIEVSQNSINIFNQYNVEATIDDYYYYDEENNGYDFIILLYKTELQQLYKYEWHQ